ncbi:MAG: DUF296 domain-containing protein [Chitinivibrionales bacterium]|nr:DUF296 domain-containing protein [Chitinivibrionales bacterium]
MKYSSGKTGRVVVARLEDGDDIYECIECIAATEKIDNAVIWIIGGMKNGGVVVGPETPVSMPPDVMIERFEEPREVLAVGTLFPAGENRPSLHLHAGMGRGRSPLVGCPRIAAECWLIDEVVVLEITGINAARIKDPDCGLELLTLGPAA